MRIACIFVLLNSLCMHKHLQCHYLDLIFKCARLDIFMHDICITRGERRAIYKKKYNFLKIFIINELFVLQDHKNFVGSGETKSCIKTSLLNLQF